MIRFAVFALIFACYALPAMAADSGGDVLPPPTTVKDTPEAKETVPADSGPSNLRKELTPEQKKEGVQVYVYERKNGAKIAEYSMHGRVYMIHVQPPGNLPGYYLYDRAGTGKFERLPGGAKPISPPMWVIKRF